jgi:hypothetical protein
MLLLKKGLCILSYQAFRCLPAACRTIRRKTCFTGKCLLIAIVMFFGVLFGMQQANSGMLDMKGYNSNHLISIVFSSLLIAS